MALGLVFMGTAFGVAALCCAGIFGVCAQEFTDAERRGDKVSANVMATDALKAGAVTVALWIASVLCFLGAAQ